MKALLKSEGEIVMADQVAEPAANQNSRLQSGSGRVQTARTEAKRPPRGRQMDEEAVRRVDGLAKAYFNEILSDAQGNARFIEMVNSFKS